MTRVDWVMNILTLSLLYFGVFHNMNQDNTSIAALLAWFAGIWSMFTFILFLEDRTERD